MSAPKLSRLMLSILNCLSDQLGLKRGLNFKRIQLKTKWFLLAMFWLPLVLVFGWNMVFLCQNEFVFGGKRKGKGMYFENPPGDRFETSPLLTKLFHFWPNSRPELLAIGLLLEKDMRKQGINYLLVLGTSALWWKENNICLRSFINF